MITSTISWPELLWTIAALVGLIYNTKILFNATKDLFILRVRRINSIREYAAMTTVYAFGTWSVVQFTFAIIGVHAMTNPNPDNSALHQVVPTVALISVSIILAISAVIVDKRRKYLRHQLEELES